ncbi:hypothetical protein [Singulisphaera acidiphila]|uniref:Uncharacterized protein n=1 Tax=Singulisphaera acidiphila (strain ATCC BAA-1392 / DSM 18658 / VKM B-2454 / MOB10) TaxID=886293 RepID=L0DLD7_SINAD|nr:hypothetical protein [Singulisphaera acidiphila]AGA30057.1 hypothetical protein Sinac_5946 [Singulisphaera acidiphila DSM 18658]
MFSLLLLIPILAAGADSKDDGPQATNSVYRALVAEGFEIEGKTFTFPPPLLHDGQTAEVQREILHSLLESERKAAEFLRDSVSAPFILKLKDETTTNSLVRRADLWFAVHASLDDIDLDAVSRNSAEAKPIEVGNMRFESRLLGASELEARGIAVPKADDPAKTLFIHQTGRLLDRIHVEGTDMMVASRSANSWVIAARTDRRFDKDPKAGNRWWPISRRGNEEQAGPAHPFPGGASYVTITRLASDPNVLVAEAHFSFAEPRAWFDGAPILRSKISLIAQDQIRQLRRDIAKRKERSKTAKP